jgi:hypothetical protein
MRRANVSTMYAVCGVASLFVCVPLQAQEYDPPLLLNAECHSVPALGCVCVSSVEDSLSFEEMVFMIHRYDRGYVWMTRTQAWFDRSMANDMIARLRAQCRTQSGP